MKKDRDRAPDDADLRRHAETRLREQETQIDRLPTAEETQRLVHPLRGQIEFDGTHGARFSLRFAARRGEGAGQHEEK